jgi:hypothetical protein
MEMQVQQAQLELPETLAQQEIRDQLEQPEQQVLLV